MMSEKSVEQKKARLFKKDWAWAFIRIETFIKVGKALKYWRWNKFRKAFALTFYVTCFILPQVIYNFI